MLFGRKKGNTPKQDAGKLIADFLAYQAETENMKGAARAADRPVVLLHPQLPITAKCEAGWFGGQAALPEGMKWPERDGEKLLFLGQINLAALPSGLWSGVGPRSGWLGFFLPMKWPHKPTVLHFDGPLVDTKGPPPNSADWTRSHDFNSPKTFALPRWPVVIETMSGQDYLARCEQPSETRDAEGSLLDPAYHPFDGETVAVLLEALNTAITGATQAVIRFPHMKKIRAEDADWFARGREVMLDTFVRFLEIEGRMKAISRPDAKDIATMIDELARLATYDFRYMRNDGEGFCEFEFLEGKLLDPRPVFSNLRSWWYRHEAGLRNHALRAYTSGGEPLPRPLRERLEDEWRRETTIGLGAMGHAPSGHIYTPHGPDSPNEVLLELHTRRMAGWIWADCYSLVILINREALARGDFSEVMFDITN